VKAWHLAEDFTDYYGHLLVYADTSGRAKALGQRCGPWDYEEYTAIRCRRAPAFDGLFDNPTFVATNDPLPDGLEFYADEAWE